MIRSDEKNRMKVKKREPKTTSIHLFLCVTKECEPLVLTINLKKLFYCDGDEWSESGSACIFERREI